MANAELLSEIQDLSEIEAAAVVAFVKFFKISSREKDNNAAIDNKRNCFDVLKGKLKYMADDFDETPECFKEYI